MPRLRLKEHQIKGFKFCIRNGGGIVYYKPGRGKTFIAMAVIKKFFKDRVQDRFVVVCPTNIIKKWEKEIREWLPMFPLDVLDTGKKRIKNKRGIILTTYGVVRGNSYLFNFPATYFFDEAHHLKNPEAKVSMVAQSLPRTHTFLLTGTPIKNRPEDIYMLIRLSNPSLVGEYNEFLDEYTIRELRKMKVVTKSGYNFDIDKPTIVGYINQDKLARIVDSVTVRDNEHDIKLPPLKQKIIKYKLRNNRGLYNSVFDETRQEWARFSIPTAFAYMEQILSGYDPINDDFLNNCDKFNILKKMLTQIGDRVVIWCHYLTTVEYLKTRLQAETGRKVLVSSGAQQSKERAKAIEQWSSTESSILIATPSSSGEGNNLVQANKTIFYEWEKTSSLMTQAYKRLHRIGQEKKVYVFYIFGEDTIEESLYRLVYTKATTNDKITSNKITRQDMVQMMKKTVKITGVRDVK